MTLNRLYWKRGKDESEGMRNERKSRQHCTDDHRHCIMDVAATAAAASVFKPLVAADGERLHIAGLSETAAAAAGPYL